MNPIQVKVAMGNNMYQGTVETQNLSQQTSK